MHVYSFLFTRVISVLFVVLFLLATTACSSGDSSLSTHKNAQGGVSLPGALKTDLPDNGTLTAYIRVDAGERQQMTLEGDNAVINLIGLIQGNHTFTVEFEFVFNAKPDKPFILASATKSANLSAGSNTLTIAETDYAIDGFDEDGDGQSNLVELINKTSPFAGFIISAISGNTAEDATAATFTIALTNEPTADVTVAITSSDTTEGTVDKTLVAFDASNWSTAQLITITGVDDSIADGDINYTIILAAATSTDTNYNGLTLDDVSLTNTDDDLASFTLSAISGNTTEAGATAFFTVNLSSQPTHDVTIGISSSDTTEGRADKTSMTFTPANWNIAQTVTVTGIDDTVADGNQAFSIQLAEGTSADNQFDGQNPPDVSVINIDNDSPGFNISPISGNTAEDGTSANFTAQLTSQPTANVTFSINSSNTAEGTVDKASITFDTNNWNSPQTITVTGVGDDVDDGDKSYTIILTTATSDDVSYSGQNPDNVTVVNTDNDAPPSVVLSVDKTSIAEAGGVALVTAILSGLSVQDVIVNLSYSGTAATGDDYTLSNSINIPAGSATGVASISARQDSLDEEDETIVIDISSVTSGVESEIQSITTSISDDDQPPTVTLSINTASPLAEAAGTANLTATLSEKSGRAVSVNLLYSGTAKAGTDYTKGDTITIAAGNTFAQVALTAIDDTLDEKDESIIIDIDTVTHGVEVTPQQVSASIADDDVTPIVNFSTASQSVAESVGTVTLTISLNQASGLDVSVPFTVSGTATSGGPDHNLANDEIVIPADQTTATIIFTVQDDTLNEANETVIVTLSNSVNATLGATTIHTVTITDNDYSIGGTISGLTGTLVLQTNFGNDLTLEADGNFTFNNALADGSSYVVTALNQPGVQTCLINNSTGTVFGSDVSDIEVSCVENNVLSIDPQSRSVKLSWNDTNADSYNLYYTSEKGFDPDNYANIADGTLLTNITNPITVTNLVNGTAYYFVLETVYAAGVARSMQTASRPNEWAFNGSISAIATHADGTVYFGGGFTQVRTPTGSGVPLKTNNSKPEIGDFPIVNGTIRASAADGRGGWYIGGDFTQVGGIARNRLAHILANGSVNLSWNPDANNSVYTLAVDGTTVYVGGWFTSISGTTRNHLAAIGTDGSLANWNPDTNDLVKTLAIEGTTVYMGGGFTSIGGTTRNRLAAISTDGTLTNWNPDANNWVETLAVEGTTVYVGGGFTSIGGTTRNRLTAIGTDGALSNWNPNANSWVDTLAIDGTTVYVGGWFTSIGGTTRNHLAAISTDGTLSNWNPDANDWVETLTSDGATIYAGGRFTAIGGTTRNHLAAIGTDGGLSNWNPNANDWVETLTADGSTVYVGGSFTSIGGTTRNRLAAIGTDGGLTSWNPDANNVVQTLAVDGATVYVGGWFTSIGGTTRNHLAAISTDGTLDNWNPDANDRVGTLAVDGTTVYVGGSFTSIGGTTRNHLAATGTDGTLASWNPDANDRVKTLAVDDSTVYVGGSFSSIGGTTRNHLAAIGTDGALASWNPDAGLWVNTLAVDGSMVYVGGKFRSIGDTSRSNLAAIGTDGMLASWNPVANSPEGSDGIFTIAIDGATIYVGGSFTTIGDMPRKHLAAIDTDGTLTSWNPVAGGWVFTLAVDSAEVYAGGGFTTIGGTPRDRLAIIGTDGVLK